MIDDDIGDSKESVDPDIHARDVRNTFEGNFWKKAREQTAHIADDGSHEKPPCVKLNFRSLDSLSRTFAAPQC